MSFVDLHVHSTASDGLLTPSELVDLTSSRGISILALTDHDTLDGVAEAYSRACGSGIKFIPAIEFSVNFPEGNTAHLLGYFPGVSPDVLTAEETPLSRAIRKIKQGREDRNPRILSKLAGLGMMIDFEDVERKAGDGVIGRPHIADVLVEKGFVSCFREAFDLYLARGKPAYVERERLLCRQAIDLISAAEGIPVLAHPGLMGKSKDEMKLLLRSMTDYGLSGVEVYYPSHSSHIIQWLIAQAKDIDLLVTGGSDFHGRKKEKALPGGMVSGFRVDEEMIGAFLERCFPKGDLNGETE